MAEHPKVFISYSHDSPEHRRWVSELGAKLRHNGIDAILDQWDLGPGDDVTQFMERGIIDSDRVLVVCTDQYVRKANAAEGGVGYERMIVTAQLVQDLGTNKFIPIIRQASGQEKMPTCLGTRFYLNFMEESQFETEFNKLLHELHQVPVIEKPPLGKNPFSQLPSGQEAPLSEGVYPQLPEIPEQVESASDAYYAAVEIARAGDTFGWRQLVKGIKPNVFRSLVQWRQNELDGQRPESKDQLAHVVNTAVKIISPLISVALAGVESGREQFRDQKSILDDLLNIVGWNPAGYTTWVNLPNALGYVYHSLHGSLSLSTNQLELALGLARVKIPVAQGTMFLHVWEMSELRGYAQSISGTRGGNCLESWEYLVEAYQSEGWEWLSPIFQDKQEYRTSLVAYYIALNIHELAVRIAAGQQDTLRTSSEYYFTIPLTFLSEEYDITQRATVLLRRNPEALMKLWTSLNVTHEQMKDSWENWIRLSERELLRMYGTGFNPMSHHNLTDIYQHFFVTL